jgi:tetratricopeptide (TPR) repeat protein/transcriptional regulator with XRE-family HTH domain
MSGWIRTGVLAYVFHVAANFGTVLRELRHRAMMSQEQLAERCGLSVRTVRNLEAGRTAPRATTVRLLVEGLGADRPGAERLHLAAPGVPPAGAAALEPPAKPHQLPADTRLFTGRRTELQWLAEAAGCSRGLGPPLLLVSGMAGAGKTALVVRFARTHAHRYADGEIYVDLAGHGSAEPADPAEVLSRLLGRLGVEARGATVEDLAATWRSTLDGRKLILLLDNAASAAQVRPLLPATPGCCIVVTSRHALPGLVARDGAVRLDLDVLPAADSVRLLVEVIGAAAREQLPAVRRLARACGNLPLALRVAGELAMAHPGQSLADLADQLGQDPLGGLDTADDPYTGLRTVLMSSYRSLPVPAAAAFRLLGVHPTASFDRSTAVHLIGQPPAVVSAQLDALLRAYMISHVDHDRFAMHDLLHAFARELANGDPGVDAAFSRLVNHFLAAARAAVGSTEGSGRLWLVEHRQVLVATAIGAARCGRFEATVEFAQILGQHLNATAAYKDILVLLASAAEAAERLDRKRDAAEAWRMIGVAHYRLGHPEPAISNAQRALTAFRAVGDRIGEARCLMNIGTVRWRSGSGHEALRWYQEALDIYRTAGDSGGEADVLCNIGNVLKDQGRNDAAIGCYTDAIAKYQTPDKLRHRSVALCNLGEVYLKLGWFGHAGEAQHQSLRLAREIGNLNDEGIALGNLGEIALYQGLDRDARRYLAAALRAARDTGDRIGEGLALDNLGVVDRRRANLERAERLHGHGLRIAGETGNRDGECAATIHLAEVAVDRRDFDTARTLCAQALAMAHDLDSDARISQIFTVLATVDEAVGDVTGALATRRRSLAFARRAGDVPRQAMALLSLATHHDRYGTVRLADRHRRLANTIIAPQDGARPG